MPLMLIHGMKLFESLMWIRKENRFVKKNIYLIFSFWFLCEIKDENKTRFDYCTAMKLIISLTL